MNYRIPKNAKICYIDGDEIFKLDNSYMRGLLIKTDKGDIKLLIDDHQQCCEIYGSLFFETPDNPSKFIGAKIISIEDINVEIPILGEDPYRYETQLKIATTRGVLQYAVYNSHNGYYSHATVLQIFDIEDEYYL